jgi:uncharacterized protein
MCNPLAIDGRSNRHRAQSKLVLLKSYEMMDDSMKLLIDGYNLMYATGYLGRRVGAEAFRKERRRFLNEIAGALDPAEAQQTTIVFDASPEFHYLPQETNHEGLAVEFAVDDENADARIEWLIAHHATPKSLTVVSSDRRIRQAAHRRRSQVLTSEDFLERLNLRRERRPTEPEPPPTAEDVAREHGLSASESAYWQSEFRELSNDTLIVSRLRANRSMLTDEEIAQIEREVESEHSASGARSPANGGV